MSGAADEQAPIREGCGNEACFCCGTKHRCEPTRTAATLGETWVCPECGETWQAFSPHTVYPPDHVVLKHLPLDALGWRATT